jgi:SAM-dependent methyltransferase
VAPPTLPPLTPNASLRYDLVRDALAEVAGRDGPLGDVLEVGVGQGAVGARLAVRSRYTGCDLDPVSLATARRRILAASPTAQVLSGAVEDVVPAAERFDWVCAFEVLEHIGDDRGALASWVGRLRPGGHLLLSVPAFADRYGPSDRMVGHFRRYDPTDLRALLVQTGLADVSVRCYGVPLGYVLDGARNAIGRRRGFPGTPDSLGMSAAVTEHGAVATDGTHSTDCVASMETSTLGSGRLFQPEGASFGRLIAAGTWPFRAVQRRFPDRGTGLVATGVLPS